MDIGFHTDAFCSAHWNFEKCLQWAEKERVRHVEFGLIDGVFWMHGLGYFPHVAMYEDPVCIRNMAEKYGVTISQIDAAYPLSGVDGPSIGVPYVLKAIPWAKLAGCNRIAITDGLHRPKWMTDEDALNQMKRSFAQIVELATLYEVYINIEIHGYFTTKPDYLDQMLRFVDSPWLLLNFDTGNSFIAGQDPVSFCKRFIDKIDHVHIKDVSESLALAARGQESGIALSEAAVGDGVNAENIHTIIQMLHQQGFNGTLCIEGEAQGGPLLTKSVQWLRKTLDDLGIPHN